MSPKSRPLVLVWFSDYAPPAAQPTLTVVVQVEPELLKQMSMEETLLSAV